MNITYPTHSASLTSWEKDGYTNTLTALVIGASVHLTHFEGYGASAVVTTVQLDADEAFALSERVQVAMAGSPVLKINHYAEDEDEDTSPRFRVYSTTDGEPYREGVAVGIVTGDYMRDFTFTMTKDTACKLAKVLAAAKA